MGIERTHDPARELVPGASVLVVRPSNRPPALQVGSVEAYESSVLALALPLGEDFEPGEEILLVLHSAGVRFAGAARFVGRDPGGVITLHLDGGWRHVDVRNSLRFPCAHPAELSVDEETSYWPATIADISLLGAGVIVASSPETTSVRLGLRHNQRHATLACRIVAQRPVESHVVLSLVFEDLNPTQRAFVDELYEHYRAAFLEALPFAS